MATAIQGPGGEVREQLVVYSDGEVWQDGKRLGWIENYKVVSSGTYQGPLGRTDAHWHHIDFSMVVDSCEPLLVGVEFTKSEAEDLADIVLAWKQQVPHARRLNKISSRIVDQLRRATRT